MKEPKSTVFSLTSGESHMRSESPALFVLNGAQPYLWIGNDGTQNKGCFATISGRARLQRIAKAILKVVK